MSYSEVLKYSINVSIVAVFILLIKALFKKKLPATWHYAIWSVLLIRLIVPSLPEARFSLFNYVVRDFSITAAKDTVEDASVIQHQETERAVIPTVIGIKESEPPKPAQTYERFLLWIWLAGTSGLLVYFIIVYRHLRKRIRGLKDSTEEKILELLESCKKQVRITKEIHLLVGNNSTSPMLVGYIKPKLIIPAYVISEFDLNQLKYVMLHELVHLKHKDILLNWVMMVFRTIHWFNPFLWYIFNQIQRDCEIACDARVLSICGTGSEIDYGKTLISIAAQRKKII